MEALGAAASVAGLISLAIEIPRLIDVAVSIWSAPDEAEQLSKTANALVITLRKLETFLKTDEAREMRIADDSAMVLAISHCQTLILTLSRKLQSQTGKPPKTPGISTTKIKSTMTRFRWPLDKTQCLDIISEIHALQNTFEFCLVIANCRQMSKSHKEAIAYLKTQSDTLTQMAASFPQMAESAKNTLKTLDAIESCVILASQKVDRIQVGVEELQEMKKDLAEYHSDRSYGQALEWLSPIDPSVRHEELRYARLSGTCEWICADDTFQQFVQCPPSGNYPGVLCWVGDPGQGKTYTMSRVVDYLGDLTAPNAGSYVTYLYCDYQRTRSYSATALVGALVRQLLTHFDTLPRQVDELVRQVHVKMRRSNARMDEIHQVLEILKPQVTRLFVCVDALDECNDADSLVAACQRFPIKTSFLFIGRQTIARTVKRAFPFAIGRIMEAQNVDINAVISALVKDDKEKDSDLMPDWLFDEILTEISKLANGMFLLASLHTTLVLSHTTIHRRREALRNLPHTLDSTFGQTLERIQTHLHAAQAFRLLAWLHTVGPLPLQELQYALAVECHHTKFQEDNLPSRASLLDCCLGLVRFENTSQTVNPSNNVTLVHSTLSIYFDSRPTIFGSALYDIAGACLVYLSFDPPARPDTIHALMRDSWVQLLYKANDIPRELQESVWQYCTAINAQINDGAGRQVLPRQALELKSHRTPAQLVHHRQSIQSVVHTVCMLGLDCVEPFLKRLAEVATQCPKTEVNGLDKFGMSPLGWILLSRNHFDKHKSLRTRPSSFDSFEHSLWRAERLIANFPGLDPSQGLWDMAALEHIRAAGTTYANGNRIEYYSVHPSLFLLGNYSSAPEATSRCLSLMSSHLKLNIWTTLRYDRTSNATPNTINKQSDDLWSLCVLDNTEMSVFRDIDKESESTLVPYDTVHPDVIPARPQNSAPLAWTNKNLAALFEPGKDVPALVIADWLTGSLGSYSRSRRDMTMQMTNPFPGTTCWCWSLPKETLLHVSAICNSVVLAKFALFTYRLSPNKLDHQESTAMHQALRHLSIDTALFLIEHADINLAITDFTGMSALHICAQRRLITVASRILARFAVNVNLRDCKGRTALHYAAEQGSRRMVKLLLDNQADVNVEDGDGATPLHVAIMKRDAFICEIILDANLTFSPSSLQKAWNLTVEAGASFVMLLVRTMHTKPQGLLLPAPGPGSSSALTQNARVLQLVLAAESSSNFKEEDMEFMLKLSQSNEVSVGTPAGAPGAGNALIHLSKPETTIREAIVKGAENVAVHLLRRFPIELDHLGEDGESVLHLAAVYDAAHLARFVLDHTHADVTRVDPQGYTALQLALVHRRLRVLQVLLETPRVPASDLHATTGVTVLTLAITRRFLDAIPLLLRREDVAVNHLDASGRTALHRAVIQQDLAAVKLLLDCPRVSAATPTSDGRTALACAALCAGPDMVSLLLRTGAFDLGHKDSQGNTALDWARRNPSKEVEAMLQAACEDRHG